MKYTRSVLFSLTFALVSTSALSADLPSKSYYNPTPNTYTAPSAFSWTGFYVGANVGYGWPKSKVSVWDHGFIDLDRDYKKDSGSVVFGGQVGYNYQMDNVVVGAEADINFADLKSRAGGDFNYVGGHYSYEIGSKVKWYGTLRARVGLLANERLLFFGTGGLAFANVKTTASDRAIEPTRTWGSSGSSSDTRIGWTLGVGAEYALTQNITAKLEYSYVDLSSDTNSLGVGAHSPKADGMTIKDDPSFQTVRAGVNYKF